MAESMVVKKVVTMDDILVGLMVVTLVDVTVAMLVVATAVKKALTSAMKMAGWMVEI